ncbi:MEIOTIC F-BOX protein MOF-like [Lolium perenne]|uniref:MEIOTIC F-BOX protein MOF-like n=1 Tax=Lolium perenne TaxID=4522 RepID=UPI0021F60080|nr:MEIOTIC F-BOX protein MOF-like [Lolium perenne]
MVSSVEVESVPPTALPSRKRARRLDTAEDRLSDLPDCLLHAILARLQSRQAVQTSTLSRRWRHLWRSVPCVDIDQRQFPGSHVPGSRQRGRFEDFADSMLAFAGAAPSSRTPLDAFRLHLVDGGSASSDRWVRRGLKRRPATVDIRCSLGDFRGMVEWPPGHVNLAAAACRLTTLTLFGVTLRHGFAERLGALCPAIQDLRIDNCHHHSSHCTIVSPSLKFLTLFCRMSYPYSSAITLAIASPRLATLFLFVPFGGTGVHPVITAAPGHQALASLARASICIYDRDRPNKRPNKTKLEFLRSMRVFLARLSNVRILRLSGFTSKALLDHESQEFPTFQNLTTLVLRCCDVGAFNSQVLLRMLDSTPNLEKIGLYHCKVWMVDGTDDETEQKREPRALTHCGCKAMLEIHRIAGTDPIQRTEPFHETLRETNGRKRRSGRCSECGSFNHDICKCRDLGRG